MTTNSVTKAELISLSNENLELLQTVAALYERVQNEANAGTQSPKLGSHFNRIARLIKQDARTINEQKNPSPSLKNACERGKQELTALKDELESLLGNPKDNYNYLFDKIASSCSTSRFKKVYLQDKTLKNDLKKLSDSFERLKDTLSKQIFNKEATEEDYKTGIGFLENFQNTHRQLEAKVKNRFAELELIVNAYKERIQLKSASVNELRKLIEEATQLTNHPKNNAKFEDIKQKLAVIAKHDYLTSGQSFVQSLQGNEAQRQEDMTYLSQIKKDIQSFINKKKASPEYPIFKETKESITAMATAVLNKAKQIAEDYEALKSQPQLKEIYSQVLDKIQDMEKTDYIPTLRASGDYTAETERFTNDHEQLTGLTDSLKTISETVAQELSQLEQKERDIQNEVNKLNEEIFNQIESFSSKSDALKAKLKAHNLSDSDITAIETKFNTENVTNLNESRAGLKLKFLQNKLANLKSITQELEAAIINKEEEVSESAIKGQIDKIVSNVEQRRGLFNRTVKNGNEHLKPESDLKTYQLMDTELVLLQQLNSLQIVTENYKSIKSSSQMSTFLATAEKNEQEFNALANQFDAQLKTHTQVQLILSNDDPIRLITGMINSQSTEEALNFLSIINQYQPDLLSAINKNGNIIQLEQKGRDNLTAFINQLADPKSEDAKPLKGRLKYISILCRHNITTEDIAAKNYLNDMSVINTTKLLVKNGLDKFITQENLDNTHFHQALEILVSHEIKFSEEIIKALSQDVNKCQLLKFITNEDQWPSFEKSFKTVFPILIANDTKISRSFNILKTKAPHFCQPWLFIASQTKQVSEPNTKGFLYHTTEIRTLLRNPDKIEQAIPFLNVRIPKGREKSLNIRFNGENSQLMIDSFLKIRSDKSKGLSLNAYLSHLNGAMRTNKDFDKVSKIMASIQSNNAVSRNMPFNQQAASILLTNNGLKDKQEKLCELARKMFPLSIWDNLVDTVISVINSAFAAVSDNYKYGFFDRVQTSQTKAVKDSFKEATAKAVDEPEATEEKEEVNEDKAHSKKLV